MNMAARVQGPQDKPEISQLAAEVRQRLERVMRAL